MLTDAPGVEAILVCRQLRVVTVRSAMRSVRRNVRKHGPLFLPWRLWHGVFGHFRASDRPWPAPSRRVRVEHLSSRDIHGADVLEAVRDFAPDLGVSLGAPILKRLLFGVPGRGTINLHSGTVPDFRGAPPAFWELYTGAGEIGATIHWMDDGLDTGPLLCQTRAPIYPFDSLARVEARAQELGVQALRTALAAIAKDDAPSVVQPAGGRTYRQPTVRQRLHVGAATLRRRLLRRVLNARSGARLIASLFLLVVVRPMRDAWRTARGRHPVRVFTFHRVTDLCRDGMTVSPDVFRQQMEYVRKHHDIVSLDQALAVLRSGARLRRPLAVITFDDGYRSVFESAAPVLQQLGVVGCCFICTDFVGTARRFPHDDTNAAREHFDVMDWPEIEELRRRGWSIGGHTASHVRLAACDTATQRAELQRSRTALRERLGLSDITLAYPFGGPRDITPQGVTIAHECGYAAVFSDFGGDLLPGRLPSVLGRWELGGDHDAIAWRAKIHSLDLEQFFTIRRIVRDQTQLTTTSARTA